MSLTLNQPIHTTSDIFLQSLSMIWLYVCIEAWFYETLRKPYLCKFWTKSETMTAKNFRSDVNWSICKIDTKNAIKRIRKETNTTQTLLVFFSHIKCAYYLCCGRFFLTRNWPRSSCTNIIVEKHSFNERHNGMVFYFLFINFPSKIWTILFFVC